ncbi:hypothetical protein KFY57_27110, partial [Salmonella enterica subsp. enterica serovar Typhimurium]|nr:hypothetical protein [Salmonella enterica subsp. enterica serovar Typhimurium]
LLLQNLQELLPFLIKGRMEEMIPNIASTLGCTIQLKLLKTHLGYFAHFRKRVSQYVALTTAGGLQ